MSQGTIVQCIGAVTDIQFPREAMPKVYDALLLEESGEASFVEKGLTFEVEQQLGDGVVRCIALGSSDGLRRGMKVSNTGAPISVPVGHGTLGRIMDVLGRPIDEAGPVKTDEKRSIHQPAPAFARMMESGRRIGRSGPQVKWMKLPGVAAAAQRGALSLRAYWPPANVRCSSTAASSRKMLPR